MDHIKIKRIRSPEAKARRAAQQREYRAANKEKTKREQTNWNLKRLYGISLDEYEALSEAQGHVCAICGSAETAIFGQTGEVRKLNVDHCHQSGKVRGLLCVGCNRGLGFFRDNPDSLRKAAEYLGG